LLIKLQLFYYFEVKNVLLLMSRQTVVVFIRNYVADFRSSLCL